MFVDVGTIPDRVAPVKDIIISAALLFCIVSILLDLFAAKQVTLVAVATVGLEAVGVPVMKATSANAVEQLRSNTKNINLKFICYVAPNRKNMSYSIHISICPTNCFSENSNDIV